MQPPLLRLETTADVAAIHRLTAEAFRNAPHTSGTEAFIVDALRNAGALTLSLVAEDAGVLVGHVGLSPVTVADGSTGWYGLGPVSVLPSHQGRGIGSALVRDALARLRAMGASGCVLVGEPAYYGRFGFEASAAMAADEVVADPATVTGSIGVFALLPRADRALEKLGVHAEGVTTTWLVGAGDPRLPLDPRFNAVLQTHIQHVYGQFTGLVARARQRSQPEVDAVAQGRVWTGAQALERGLVDTLGGIDVALQSAARRAKLEGQPRVLYIEPDRSRFDRVLGLIGSTVAGVAADELEARLPGLPVPAAARAAEQEMGWLLRQADGSNPFASLAHCLCSPY